MNVNQYATSPRIADQKQTAPFEPAAYPVAQPNEQFVCTLALYAAEIVHCGRSVSNLSAWATAPVVKKLQLQQIASGSARANRTQPVVTFCGKHPRAHIFQTTPVCIDAVVALSCNGRAFAVAIRLVYRSTRWRAEELTVL